MPALFARAAAEAVLFIHAGEGRLDVLRMRELIAGHDRARGAGFDSQTLRIEHVQSSGDTRDDPPNKAVNLNVEAVLAQLLESADIWFEQADADVGGRQSSRGAGDDPV